MIQFYTEIESTLGKLLVLSDENETITGLYFVGQKHAPAIASDWQKAPKTFTKHISQQLAEYLQGQRKELTLPYRFANGTPFQQKVWKTLATVPCGSTISYRELAERIGAPTSIRAVASAVAKNPISLIVPCHRIIGSNGALTGYAGGIKRKETLLRLEK